MAHIDFKDTHSWQAAIALGPHLMKLAEEMPATEELGLSWQLRQAMVELPATVADDLLRGEKKVRFMPILKLQAVLELVDKIYPALDTAAARTAADKLAERLTGPGFDERIHGKTPALKSAEHDEPRALPGAGPDAVAPPPPAPAPPPPRPEPSSVPVLEAPASQPSVSVPVETDVHPDSSQ